MIAKKMNFKIIKILLSLTAVIFFMSLSYRICNAKGSKEIYTYYKTITINRGMTLNDIALEYNNSDIQNTNDYIVNVMDLNHISDDNITSGENLVIPYFSSKKK